MFGEVASYVSKFSSREEVEGFCLAFIVSSKSLSKHILAKACENSDLVYMKHMPDSDDFTSVYEYFFKEHDITFPLSSFEA